VEHKFEVTIQSEDGPKAMANLIHNVLILSSISPVSVKPIQESHVWYKIEWGRDSHRFEDEFQSLDDLKKFRQCYPDVIVHKVTEVTKLYRELNPTGV
jgi:hypothetical protein